MNNSLPFEPLDAYESLQLLLPSFTYKFSKSDLRSYIINGFVTRKFILRGRFNEFGHTRAMRSPEDLTIKSFLQDSIPQGASNPVYDGDAVGFVLEETRELFTKHDKRRLTDFPDNARLRFIYQRPRVWQPLHFIQDQVHHVQYVDEIERRDHEAVEVKVDDEMTIFQLLNIEFANTSFLVEAFEHAVEKKSRFGYTADSLFAMKALALIYRISKKFEDAENVLGRALSLSYSVPEMGDEIKYQLLYDFGALYLDQGNTYRAEQQFSLILKSHLTDRGLIYSNLHARAHECLAAIAFRDDLLPRVETLLESLLIRYRGISEMSSEYLITKHKQSMLYCAQGQLDLAQTICEETLVQQEKLLGPLHYHCLRTCHTLAGILSEKRLISESQSMYVRELTGLKGLLGSNHEDVFKTTELLAYQSYELSNFGYAIELWQELLHSYERILGVEHPSAIEARFQLALSLKSDGRSKESMEYLELLIKQCDNVYEKLHPITLRAKVLRSNVQHHLGDYSQSENNLHDLHNYLYSSNADGQYLNPTPYGYLDAEQRLELHLRRKVEGTCSWVFENESYQKWVTSKIPSLLWIRGLPGSGKSVLISAIIDTLKKNRPNSTIFFFFDFRNSATSNPKSLLDSLIAQMIKAIPRLGYTQTSLPKHALTPTSKSFARFSDLALEFQELFCCIDALDECSGSSELLLELISTMVRSEAFPVKFLMTSRWQADMLQYMHDLASVIEVPNECTEADIKTMVSSRLRNLGLTRDLDLVSVIDNLAGRSNGNFLLVDLSISESETTGELPRLAQRSINETYRESLSSLMSKLTPSETELLLVILYWVTTAFRALKVGELQTALAIEPTDTKLEDFKTLSSPYQSINSIAGLFTRILSDGSVVLQHQSLRQFFQQNSCPNIKISSHISLPINIKRSNAYISMICITYLSFNSFRHPYNHESLEANEFLEYAAKHWHLHAIRAGSEESVLSSVLSFTNSDQCFNWLEALTTLFGKSVEDILLLQSEINSWISQFDYVDTSQISRFALSLYQRRVAKYGNSHSLTHEEIVIVRKLADLYQAYGSFGEAEYLYERILNPDSKLTPSSALDGKNASIYHSRVSTIPSELAVDRGHPDVIAMSNLASTYRKQGRWLEAEKINIEAVKNAQQIFGEEHPDTLLTISNLAVTYVIQGRWREAEELQLKVVEASTRSLGKEHADTLTSMDNLASIYHHQGRLVEAEKLTEQVVDNIKRVLGEEHPYTLNSMTNLAELYSHQGRLIEAQKLAEQVMYSEKRVLGEEHPKTLTSMDNLASIYRHQGRLVEAEMMIRRTLELREKKLGKEHPSTLTSVHNLALTLGDRGKYAETLAINRRLLELREKILGTEHPDTLTSMHNLALALSCQGKYKEAELLAKQVLKDRTRILGEEHLSTLDSMNTLAHIYKAQRRSEDAILLMGKVVRLRSKVIGVSHRDTIASMNSLNSWTNLAS